MKRLVGVIRSHPKTALITVSLIVAATAFWLTSSRSPEESNSNDLPEETTYSIESTAPRLGAAVYFPQGTNPSLLEELAPEAVGAVNIEEARWKRDEIVAFGTFSGGDVRCDLLADGVVVPMEESSPGLQKAEDVFLQTFRPRLRNGDTYYVRCGVSGEVREERTVSGVPEPPP